MKTNIVRAPEHPAHVWEAQRPHFIRLYRVEKKTLDEVRQIMKDRFDFSATKRQYKRKIKTWNLEKNCKAIDKIHALKTLRSSDDSLDTASVYKVNGKDVAAHKLVRYARSYGYVIPNTVRSVPVRYRTFTALPRELVESQTSSLPLNIHARNNGARLTCGLHSDLVVLGITLLEICLNFSPLPSLFNRSEINLFILDLLIDGISRMEDGVRTGQGTHECYLTLLVEGYVKRHLEYFRNLGNSRSAIWWAALQSKYVDEIDDLFSTYHSYKKKVHGIEKSDGKVISRPLRITELPDMPRNDKHIGSPEVSYTEMNGLQDIDMRNISGSAMEDVLSLGTPTETYLESQPSADSNLKDITSNYVQPQEHMSKNILSRVPEIQTSCFDQTIEGNAILPIETSSFDLVDLSSRSRQPSQWSMESGATTLSAHAFDSIDMVCSWQTIGWPELQEEPVPDIETYLDSSLWEGYEVSSRLDFNLVSIPE